MTTSEQGRAPSLAVPAVLVAALSGAGVAVQGRFNGDLSAAGAGALVASWLSYVGTFVTALLVVGLQGRAATAARIVRRDGRWWWYAIGLCSVPIVVAFSFGIPIIGVAVASVCSVAGQSLGGLVLDARGVGVPAPLALTGRRLVGALLAIGGLLVAIAGGSGGTDASPAKVAVLCVVMFLSGALLAGQQAGNGRVALVAQDPVLPAVTSTVGGLAGVSLLVGLAAVVGRLGTVALPDEPSRWYLYLGGPLGAGITAAAAWAVRHVGTFAMSLGVVAGQMVAAIVVDLVVGTGTRWPTIVAVVLVTAATVLVVLPRRAALPRDVTAA